MSKFVGHLLGTPIFEDSSVPVGLVYPSGKKDCNKLGKRKKLLKHIGIIFVRTGYFKHKTLVHPSKLEEYLSFVENTGSAIKESLDCNINSVMADFKLPASFSFSTRYKLRKIIFSKRKFIKKRFELRSSAWDIQNFSLVDSLDNLDIIIKDDRIIYDIL